MITLLATGYCPACDVPDPFCTCEPPTMAEGDACACGNTSHASGFEPCNVRGEAMEPDINSGWPGLYSCNVCGAISRVI